MIMQILFCCVVNHNKNLLTTISIILTPSITVLLLVLVSLLLSLVLYLSTTNTVIGTVQVK